MLKRAWKYCKNKLTRDDRPGMLKQAWKLWAVVLGSYGVALVIEHLPLSPLAYFDDVLMAILHSATSLATAVLVFSAMDHILLPWFKIEQAMFADGPWANEGEDYVRAAAVSGWFLLFGAWLVAWALVFAGD